MVKVGIKSSTPGALQMKGAAHSAEIKDKAAVEKAATQDTDAMERQAPAATLDGDGKLPLAERAAPKQGSVRPFELYSHHLKGDQPEGERVKGARLDPFDEETWRPGALDRALDEAEAWREAPYLSGRWLPAYDDKFLDKYRDTLDGVAVETYDPGGFLASVGVTEPRTAGRTNIEMLKSFKLIDDYTPDPKYLPLPEKVAAGVQKTLLLLNKISPRLVDAVDKLADELKVKKMEAEDMKLPAAERYGREEEIIKGERSDASKDARYLGIARKQVPQYAFGQGVHAGSIFPDRGGHERFGSFDIARKLGFTKEQARRLAMECNNVDTNETHYRDPKDPSKRRITVSGSGGDAGDFHRHFNRAGEGEEDTRITAAKLHMDRALKLAGEGYYNAAERELGIGLHSVQDIFSHAQITPLNHSLLGDFPDFVRYHPVAMYEAAQATEGYLGEYARRLELAAPAGQDVARDRLQTYGELVQGSASAEQKMAVAEQLATYPDELTELLEDHGVKIYVGAAAEMPSLGFGLDLDGDGEITPGKWVDVDGDGVQQPDELEDASPSGKPWSEELGGYNHRSRTVFISTEALDRGSADRVLREEISHAVDLIFSEDPALKDRWQPYVQKLYDQARRTGELAFDTMDPHEFFADHTE